MGWGISSRRDLFFFTSLTTDESSSEIYPKGLIDETIKTLSLLFPTNDRETKNWFLKHQVELHLDSEIRRCRELSKEDRKIDAFQ